MKRAISSFFVLVILSVCLVWVMLNFSKGDYVRPFHKKTVITENRSDTLKALILCHASDYFVYKGYLIGFQYDLIKEMEKGIHKKIITHIISDPEMAFMAALSNEYDLVAMDYDKDVLYDYFLTFSEPHSYSYPVLIHRKKIAPNDSLPHNLYFPAQFSSSILIDSLDSKYQWNFVHCNNYSTEDLLEKLNEKEIDYVVADHNYAITLLPFYPDLKIGKQLGPSYYRSWTLNSYNVTLNDTINSWLSTFVQSKKYKNLCNRYLSNQSFVLNYSFRKANKYQISPYDHLIKRYSKVYNLDWRFVTSIIFQESKFITDLYGIGGSFGVMQIMPETAERYNISDTSSIEDQIKAGIQHIGFLAYKYGKREKVDDMYSFIAGAYNAGTGQIQDAQALCEKNGENPKCWESVIKYLCLKSQTQYATDPVVRWGYFPGKHTMKYVDNVMERYHGYVVTIKE